MLVLSRGKDETIMIGDHIEITVVEVRGDRVRIGINAPVHVPVHRKEVYLAIQRENIEAARQEAEGLDAVAALFAKKVTAPRGGKGPVEGR